MRTGMLYALPCKRRGRMARCQQAPQIAHWLPMREPSCEHVCLAHPVVNGDGAFQAQNVPAYAIWRLSQLPGTDRMECTFPI